MPFVLFLLANALLFVRPSEFIAELHAVEIYRYAIALCLVVSLPSILQQLSVRYPGVPPVATCVMLLLPATFLSGFFHGDFDLIQDTVAEFVKVLVYFILLLTLLSSAARLQQFLYALCLFCALVTMIAVVRYHADITLPPPPVQANPGNKSKIHGTYVVDEVRDPETGQLVKVQRMCGTGIFNDPNDFALLLVTGIPLSLYWLTDPTRRLTKPLWLGLLLLFGYALMLTHSRGGFLALVAGLLTLFHLRYGSARTILLGMIFLPLLFVIFAGRMTSISTGEGTGQSRIQLWAEGLTFFQQSPLFGIGAENYRQFSSHVAHNSFIHCYTELGFLGGTLFLGAFLLALKGLYDHGPHSRSECSTLPRLHPFLMAMCVAYTIGICFLSRSYIVPTYMFLGLAVVYMRLQGTQADGVPNWFIWPRLTGLSCGFLIASYTFVRVFVQWR